ncbi:Fic family protein [Niabella drilacis]|uniref:Fic/DOC family protein n=1 Tax=Niabella drilacis (strain DSM 25811 / CCM 8410 / CCUG 62505 / LMG 26954 / E90) TaxID=1285928 RepID=A0A1G6L9H5_NIADE|nr:Fic family protein [Niabella drilacis]SDC40032.1 Fic/DOC family protein [Niabella drilacis]
MEFELLKSDLLKSFEKKVTVSVSRCFKDLSETGFTIQDFKHYLLAGAVASSQIEGSTLDLDSFFVSKANHKNTREVREIENLVKAYQYAKRYGLTQKGLLTCLEILSGSFTHITKGQKGRYRKTQVGIRGWQGLVYMAIEPENVPDEMNKLFADISVLLEKNLTLKQVLYYSAYIHFIFAKIHPFADGNGRAARLLEKWFLAAHLGTAIWSIPSEKYYYDNRAAYYNGLNIGIDYYETLKQLDRILPFLSLLPKAVCYKPVD